MTHALDETTPPHFIGSEIYRGSSYGAWHPLRVPRVSQVMDLCRALDWLPASQYHNSPRARPEGLHLWHTPDYVAALQKAEQTQTVSDEDRERYHLGTHACPIFAEMFRRPATGAGAVFLAAGLLRHGGVVFAPGGGTHHGMPNRASGFCYLNDPVLAVLALKQQGLGRIAYVDIDAHHGDGVQFAFEADPDVMVLSIHEANRWPRSGALNERGTGNVFNLPVPSGLNDDEMDLIRERLILEQVRRFQPEAIVLQCGSDALKDDPMSRLALSNNAHLDVVAGLRGLSDRLLVLGGGGYNPWSVGRLWTRVWGRLNGKISPTILPAEARSVLQGLEWTGLRRRKLVAPHWLNTLCDGPNHGAIRSQIRTDLASFGT